MEFNEIISISGMPGLFRLVTNKANGAIVTSLDDNKSTFISSRTNNVSPIEQIAVYIQNEETTSLHEVLLSMKNNESKTPLPAPNASNDELKKYFEIILPTFDKEKVHVSDIKKMVKWFGILSKHDLIKELPKEEEKKDEAVETAETK